MARTTQLLNNGLSYCHFYDSDKDNYIFANYWAKGPGLNANALMYKTPEHYFQALKFPVGSQEHTDIVNANTADEARRLAGDFFRTGKNRNYDIPNINQIKSNWFNGGDYNAMIMVVRARLQQDPQFKQMLMSTGNAYIYEDTYKGPPSGGPADKKWGGGDDGFGENLLGMALMQVRNEEFQRQNNNQMIVNPSQLREQARDERRQINQNLNTKGMSMSQINNNLHPNQNIIQNNNNSTYYKVSNQLGQNDPNSAKNRVLSVLKQYNPSDMYVSNDLNGTGKVVKITFSNPNDAKNFSSFAGNATIANNGTCVILGPSRAQQVFDKLKVGIHGRTHKRPMFDVLVFESQKPVRETNSNLINQPHAQTANTRVVEALKKIGYDTIAVSVTDQTNNIKITFKDPNTAYNFLQSTNQFSGNYNAKIDNDNVSVILDGNTAQNIFNNIGVGQHGLQHPRPIVNVLIYDSQQIQNNIQTQPNRYGQQQINNVSNTLNDKEEILFTNTFININNLNVSRDVKRDLSNVFVNYKDNIHQDRYSDTVDEVAKKELEIVLTKYNLQNTKAPRELFNMIENIKKVVVTNNRPNLKF